MPDYYYHGSKVSGLRVLLPGDPGRGETFVYATSEPFYAVVLLHRPGAGLVRMWGRNDHNKKLFLVERKENSLQSTYSGQRGSIYTVAKKGFEEPKRIHREEWVISKPVTVVTELIIKDIWEYLLSLQSSNELEIYYFKDRHRHPSGSDEEIIKTALRRLVKYGDGIIKEIKEYQPHLLQEILSRRSLSK